MTAKYTKHKTPPHIKLDERNHVEIPLLNQLDGLAWEILDLDNKQHPSDSHRHAFTLLLENTSVSENRQTGEKSPTVHFIDFNHK